MYERGTGGFNGNKSNPDLTPLAEPFYAGFHPSIPQSILEFPTYIPLNGVKNEMSDADMQMSYYSSLHPRQHYHPDKYFDDQIAQGVYTLAGVIKQILFKFGDGNAEKFKSVKVTEIEQTIIISVLVMSISYKTIVQVRFTDPIFPGEKIQISTWKDDSRILFLANVQRNEKAVRVFTGEEIQRFLNKIKY